MICGYIQTQHYGILRVLCTEDSLNTLEPLETTVQLLFSRCVFAL